MPRYTTDKNPRRQNRATTRSGIHVARKALRVLVVDDDAELCQLIALSLRARGNLVTELCNPWRLLDYVGSQLLLTQRLPLHDVIVADLKMPGLSGFEILRGFREAGWMTPFIMISAVRDPGTIEEAWRLGANAYFPKPLDLPALQSFVQGVLSA